MSTSSGPGSGSGSSVSLSTSGPPNSVIWIALIDREASGRAPPRARASSGAFAVRRRPAARREPPCSNGRALRCAPMSITVVGSIAYDTVKTPFGERERMLGGAAVHFALAACFFDQVRVVGPVGEDFGEPELEVMRRRDIDISDVERVAGGKTFFWRGEYGWDLNSRETLDTQLNVFEDWQPKLSQHSR